MMKFLLPLILAIVGTAGGVGAALFLSPSDTSETADAGHDSHATDSHSSDHGGHGGHGGEPSYVKMPSQFVVPLVEDGKVRSMVIMTISLEASEAARSDILLHMPKLRDAFLRVMFDHAGLGWFQGDFTASEPMSILRTALLDKAHDIVGSSVDSILILDIARQDF